MMQSAFARIILVLTVVFLLLLTLSSCRRTTDIILVADPIFADVVLPPELPEEVEQTSDMSVRIVRYDAKQETGEIERTLSQTSAPVVLFSPLLSQQIQAGEHPDVLDAAASESRNIVYMASERQAQRFEGLSQKFFLVYAPQNGWHQVDRMLSERYEDYSRIGILFDTQQYGGRWEPDDLFPLLFAGPESQHPELAVSQEGGFSRSRISEAVASFDQKGIDTVCLVIGSRATEALSTLKKHGMLAIVEHAGGLNFQRDQLASVIEIDYPATLERLDEEVHRNQPQRHIPLVYQLTEIERIEQVEE